MPTTIQRRINGALALHAADIGSRRRPGRCCWSEAVSSLLCKGIGGAKGVCEGRQAARKNIQSRCESQSRAVDGGLIHVKPRPDQIVML